MLTIVKYLCTSKKMKFESIVYNITKFSSTKKYFWCNFTIWEYPWITLGLQKSASVKNKLLVNLINKKDPKLKEQFHTNYKKYRNLLSTLMKKSRQAYYDKYVERNWNNIKNIWKGIKSLISLKSVASNVPTVLSLDYGNTITNLYDIANTFDNYLA